MSELSCVIAERDRAVKACEQMVDRIRELIAQCEKLRAERNGVRVKVEQPLLLRIRELESINADLIAIVDRFVEIADKAPPVEILHCLGDLVEPARAARAKARGEEQAR